MENNSLNRNEKISAIKLHSSQYVVALVMLVLGCGLWRLQVLGSDNYRVLADQNRIHKIPVLAPRGRIFDREGRILVDNYPSVTCYLLRDQQRNLDADLPLIAAGLHLPIEEIHSDIRHSNAAGAAKYDPILLKHDITPDEQAFIAAHHDELPELQTEEEQRRLYPQDGFAAHLIGYVGEISPNDLQQSRFSTYEPGQVVGKSGVEETYDAILRGTDGSRDVIVNSHGKEVGVLGQELATPGQDIKLTIDLDIQMAAEKALEGKIGAIVAMDPHTGEILAMASRPTFDPNQFLHLTHGYWQSILDNPDHPLMNKTIQAQLAPGSTFKVIMTYAGLQEGVAQDMHVNCAGGANFYGHFFACDKHHGSVDIHNALPYSCDTFYYTLANKLGIETMARYANSVGIGVKTGIDLPDEQAGVMPSEEWKMKTQHEKWYAGETISPGIGQGAIEVTPMQLCSRHQRHCVRRRSAPARIVVFPDEVKPDFLDAVHSEFPGSGDKTVPLDPANWQIITDDMANVTGPGGTAAEAHLEGVDFAGKTGTAQVMSHDALSKTNKGHNTVPNAWFVGIAPRRNPDIVVAVLWEHGNWGNNSAKLAAQVISAYVTKQRSRAGNLVKVAETSKPAQQPAPAPTSTTPQASSQPADDRAARRAAR